MQLYTNLSGLFFKFCFKDCHSMYITTHLKVFCNLFIICVFRQDIIRRAPILNIAIFNTN